MDQPLVSTLPTRQPRRKSLFAIRLTEAERAQIEALAQRLKLPSSCMARHFILEAVTHYQKLTEEHIVEPESHTHADR